MIECFILSFIVIIVSAWLFFSLVNIQIHHYSMWIYIQWHGDGDIFVPLKDAQLDFYSSNSLKQQPTTRLANLLGHIILILSQPAFVLISP